MKTNFEKLIEYEKSMWKDLVKYAQNKQPSMNSDTQFAVEFLISEICSLKIQIEELQKK